MVKDFLPISKKDMKRGAGSSVTLSMLLGMPM